MSAETLLAFGIVAVPVAIGWGLYRLTIWLEAHDRR